MATYTSAEKAYTGNDSSVRFQTKTTYSTTNTSGTTTRIDFNTLAQVRTTRADGYAAYMLALAAASGNQVYVEVTINGTSSKASSETIVYDPSTIGNTDSFDTFLTSASKSVTVSRGASAQTITATVKLNVPAITLHGVTYDVFGSGNNTVALVNASMSSPLTYTFTITIPAADAWTVTYNANGGTNAPATQTKQKDVALTLSSAIPTRTGYTFDGWATSANGTVSYQSGGTYTGNSALTLYAVWRQNEFDVVFDANFPDNSPETSGTMSPQHFVYGVAQNLNPCVYTAQEYTFTGWGLTPDGIGINGDGSKIASEDGATVTLYAIWVVDHEIPTITNGKAHRCEADGTIDDAGTHLLITGTCNVNDSDYSGGTLRVSFRERGSTSIPTTRTITLEGTSIELSEIVSIDGEDGFDVTKSYDVTVTFTDGFGSTASFTDVLTQAYFTLDVLEGGHGIAFGAPCTEEGFHVGMDADFSGDVDVDGDLHMRQERFVYFHNMEDEKVHDIRFQRTDNNHRVGTVRAQVTGANQNMLHIGAHNQTDSSPQGICIYNTDGTTSYTVDNGASFRNAIDAFSASGGTLTGSLTSNGQIVAKMGFNCHTVANVETAGYRRFAQLKVKSTYTDSPLMFHLVGRQWSGVVTVQFANANTTDPTLASIKVSDSNFNVYAHKSATSTWDLYLETAAWASANVTQLGRGPQSENSLIEVTWTNNLVTALPSGYVMATKGCVITEQGTKDSWYYIKFSNKYALCWRVISSTFTAGTAWGGGYYTSYSTRYAFPFTFAEVPTCIGTLNMDSGNGWVALNNNTSTTQTPTFYVESLAKYTTAKSGYLNFIVFGRLP